MAKPFVRAARAAADDAPASPVRLDRPARRRTRENWERWAWLLLVAINIPAHFARLEVRAMSHDEAIHAHSSYTYWRENDYRHDPPYHGPFLYHANAAIYAVFGDDDATARWLPALFGVALVGALYWTRGSLGRRGALAAAVLATASPTLLYYGRYIRNDIYVALFYLVWALAAFRYLRTGRANWLWGVTAGMALGFSSKEVTFIFGVTIGSFFALFGAWESVRRRTVAGGRALDLAVWMLALALPFAAPVVGIPFGLDPGAYASGTALSKVILLAGTTAAALALAAWRFGRGGPTRGGPTFRLFARHFAAFWLYLVALFTSLGSNFPGGVYSGVLGSLGYWLGQQEVARGSQPVYYYLVLGLLYELLAMLLFAAGGWAILRRRPRLGQLALGSRSGLLFFALWWGVASWILYSWAGERMPWLLVHIVLPMCLVGGWAAGWLWRGIVRRGVPPGAATLALAAPIPVLAACAVSLLMLPPAAIAESASRTMAIVVRLALSVGVVLAAWRARRRVAKGQPWRLVASGGLALLLLWTIRTSLRANFVNYDLASEPFVYAHATPDVKRALAEVEDLEQRLGGGRPLEVAFDEEVTWPMLWYLRHHPQSRFAPDPRDLSAANAVVMVGKKNFPQAEAILDRTHVRRDYRLVWWPYEGYQGLTWTRLRRLATTPEELRWLWKVVAFREYEGTKLTEWFHRSEFRLYIARELAAEAWPLGLEALERLGSAGAADAAPAPLWCEAELRVDGELGGKKLLEPAALAAWGYGGVAIADTGNHRVVLLRGDGSFERALGSACELEKGAAGGCVDPDGDGPLPLGAGQFWQPWGVAVSARGEIAVADTWNGRIQLFAPDGRFRWSWGRSAFLPGVEPAPDLLFGPRALAFDPAGDRVVVADTGNKRLVVLSSAGELLQEIAAPGADLGGFAEPIGLAFRQSDGALFVADTWNQRLLLADASLTNWTVWAAGLWPRKTGATTPYVGVDAAAHALVTDPDRDRLIDAGGESGAAVASIFARAASSSLSDPVGIAALSNGGVWVASRRDGVVLRLTSPLDCRRD